MLRPNTECHYVKYQFDVCQYAECRYPKFPHAGNHYTEYRYACCQYAECHFVGCHYPESYESVVLSVILNAVLQY
jgi:hypothetical protein